MLPLIIILRPFSWIYGLVLKLRHRLYDHGVKQSAFGPLKTFVIGNLELGGTGKTPLAIHVLKLLKDDFKMGFLSRGYGRRTKGFMQVDIRSEAIDVGDEPLLIKQCCPTVLAAVCESRLNGLEGLSEIASLDYVVLDDAFQHRQLQSGFNILVTPFSKPFWENHLIPEGSLRDIRSRAKAAHAIVISKCPTELSQDMILAYREKASWYSSAPVHFTTIKYGALKDIKGNSTHTDWPECVVVVSGIADDTPLLSYVEAKSQIMKQVSYPDHHDYGVKDVRKLKEICSKFAGPVPVLVTTSKDAVKLREDELLKELEGIEMYELPIELEFLSEGFDEMIKAYARANRRDG